ncbi:MAG: hypothetical protein GEV04_21025, partial [Actinophytocola sp.]|nr:hypothetical protein [Actinophytocola sp.]
ARRIENPLNSCPENSGPISTFTGPAGTFRQLTELTKPQRDLFTRLNVPTPKKIIELTPEHR